MSSELTTEHSCAVGDRVWEDIISPTLVCEEIDLEMGQITCPSSYNPSENQTLVSMYSFTNFTSSAEKIVADTHAGTWPQQRGWLSLREVAH